MKKVLLFISAIFFTIIIFAQKELIIKSNNKGFYVEHKVAAKENFYSIGRLYNVHPKHIAAFNGLDMNKGLVIGKILGIPLTDSNFVQDKQNGAPVYYIANEKETLANVSVKNNKVSMADLRHWNHLSSDDLAKGQKLIVGFLSSNEMKNVATTEPPKKDQINNPDIIKEKAKENADEIIIKKNEEAKQPEKEINKKEETVQVKEEPKKKNDVVQVKEESKPVDNSQGYFKSSFQQQVKQTPPTKNQTVTSGIFKTTSGWNDAKYYLIMDGVETGTIVKITNPVNNKTVYAKVLGEISSLGNSNGLDIRISNAAASVLDITETDKFILKLNY